MALVYGFTVNLVGVSFGEIMFGSGLEDARNGPCMNVTYFLKKIIIGSEFDGAGTHP